MNNTLKSCSSVLNKKTVKQVQHICLTVYNRLKGKNYFLAGQVFKPKMEYSGQNEIREVSTNTAPRINNTSPNVPDTVPVK